MRITRKAGAASAISVALLLGQGAVAQPAPTGPATAAMAPLSPVPGYLAGKPPIDMLRLLPPPPVPGSPQARADALVYKDSRREVNGALWKKAQGQLSPASPAFLGQLSCALGATISPATTPATFALVRRAGSDMAPAIDVAKKFYARPRPFSTDGGKACDPMSTEGVGTAKGAKLGFSYPSGHAAIGWLWGMILSDVRPERSAAILKFGQETGDLRMACRVHWLSDITHGRLMATAFYQRIAETAEYKADVERARSEIALAKVPEGCVG